MKSCSKCGEEKSLEEFYRAKSASDGRQSWCKDCHRVQSREWKQDNPERYKKCEKLRREANPQRMAEIAKRSRTKRRDKAVAELKQWRQRNPVRKKELEKRARERHPQKARAHQAINNAVMRGKIVKPAACEECEGLIADPCELHAHHEDYARPLDVEWLCRDCHNQRHRVSLAYPK